MNLNVDLNAGIAEEPQLMGLKSTTTREKPLVCSITAGVEDEFPFDLEVVYEMITDHMRGLKWQFAYVWSAPNAVNKVGVRVQDDDGLLPENPEKAEMMFKHCSSVRIEGRPYIVRPRKETK